METRKTAVVTGATSGLGEAAAIALAREGHRVLVVGRDAERGAQVVAKAKQAGGDAEFLAADLFSLADVHRLAGEIQKRAPRVDVLVNNAGGSFNARATT
jgi:retinol dehydrogenase-14